MDTITLTLPAKFPPHDPDRYQTQDGFEDPNMNNGTRASQFGGAWRPTGNEEVAIEIGDLIVSMLHYAHSQGHDPVEILQSAVGHFTAEAGPMGEPWTPTPNGTATFTPKAENGNLEHIRQYAGTVTTLRKFQHDDTWQCQQGGNTFVALADELSAPPTDDVWEPRPGLTAIFTPDEDRRLEDKTIQGSAGLVNVLWHYRTADAWECAGPLGTFAATPEELSAPPAGNTWQPEVGKPATYQGVRVTVTDRIERDIWEVEGEGIADTARTDELSAPPADITWKPTIGQRAKYKNGRILMVTNFPTPQLVEGYWIKSLNACRMNVSSLSAPN